MVQKSQVTGRRHNTLTGEEAMTSTEATRAVTACDTVFASHRLPGHTKRRRIGAR
jgi:hypothetical protein